MRRIVMSISMVVAVLIIGSSSAEKKDDHPMDVSYWMKKKLDLTKDVMVGLASSDFEELENCAKTIRTLNTIEGWVRRAETKEYRRQLKFFEQANENLLTHALDENLDGAALAFTQMTLSCVNCHKHLRDSTSP